MSKDNQNQKGISIYLSLVILAVLLAISLGMAGIFLGQVDVMRGMGYSVIAFYAADAGIERILLSREDPFLSPAISCTEATPCSLNNGAQYYINVSGAAGSYIIKSGGNYKEANRALEIAY